jgi:flotillin
MEIQGIIGLVVALVVVVFFFATWLLSRYRRCPPDRIMVTYGRVGRGPEGRRSARCIHGGAAFVWPIIQDYQFLDLTPFTIDIDLREALSKQNIRINVPSTFTVGISTETGVMENAAERLLGLSSDAIKRVAEDIIFGQLRVVIATMYIEQINADRDKFLDNVTQGVEVELKKIGLRLINVNVKDISDKSGYIEALGKEAAAQAINEAKKRVAERTRDGEIGRADAEREQRIQVAAADAEAVDGENQAKIQIANSNADRREKEAEANKRGTAAEKVQSAKALEEAYVAERAAELQRAERHRATQTADIVVPQQIEKQRIEIAAEAEAERLRRVARGQADAIYAKLEAEARGNREILVRQAEGLMEIVKAASGDPRLAAMLMITDKLPEMVRTQVDAVKGLNIDKVVVWDTMAGDGKGGASSTTANYLASLMKSLPPLENLFNIAGLSLPDFLLKAKEAEKAAGATKFEYSPPPAPKLTPEPPAGGDEPATGK